MRWFCTCCFLLINIPGYDQGLLKGTLVDSAHKSPLQNTLVFLNGTSFGTRTDKAGKFTLRVPPGSYTVVAAFSDRDTKTVIIDGNNLPDSINFTLKGLPQSKRKAPPGFEETDWEHFSQLFFLDFTGSSDNEGECKIKNRRALHFFVSNNNSELRVSADEPLIIENKFLGYILFYQLESFACNTKTFAASYTGYYYFKPIEGTTSQQSRWQDNRASVYHGSLMHFFRSVYMNRVVEEGFEVRHLKKVRNLPAALSTDTKLGSSDSIPDYVDQVLNPDNYKESVGMPLTADSIAYAVDHTTAALEFRDFLLVIYRNKSAPTGFTMKSGSGTQSSQLLLVNRRAIRIDSNGNYYDPADLLVLDYWSWAETIPTMLPTDYVPL